MNTIPTNAIVLEGYGGPNLLQPEIDRRSPNRPHIRLRITVRYAGVGPTTSRSAPAISPHVFPSPPGTVLGFEVAGIVETVGAAVTGIARRETRSRRSCQDSAGMHALALADHWVPQADAV